ncbi:unnamed protein product [Prunus armeniaca]
MSLGISFRLSFCGGTRSMRYKYNFIKHVQLPCMKLKFDGVFTLNEPYKTLVPSSLSHCHGINRLVIPTRDYCFAPSLNDTCCAADFIHESSKRYLLLKSLCHFRTAWWNSLGFCWTNWEKAVRSIIHSRNWLRHQGSNSEDDILQYMTGEVHYITMEYEISDQQNKRKPAAPSTSASKRAQRIISRRRYKNS